MYRFAPTPFSTCPLFCPYPLYPGLLYHTPAKVVHSVSQQWSTLEPRPAHVEKRSPLVIGYNGYTSPGLLFISSVKWSSWIAASFSSLSSETSFGREAIAASGPLLSIRGEKTIRNSRQVFKAMVQIIGSLPLLFV